MFTPANSQLYYLFEILKDSTWNDPHGPTTEENPQNPNYPSTVLPLNPIPASLLSTFLLFWKEAETFRQACAHEHGLIWSCSFGKQSRSYLIIFLFSVLRISEHFVTIKSLILMTTPSKKYLLSYLWEHLAFQCSPWGCYPITSVNECSQHSGGRSALCSPVTDKETEVPDRQPANRHKW